MGEPDLGGQQSRIGGEHQQAGDGAAQRPESLFAAHAQSRCRLPGDLEFHQPVKLGLKRGHGQQDLGAGHRRQTQFGLGRANVDRAHKVDDVVGRRRNLRVKEGELRDQVLGSLRHRRPRHDQLADGQMREGQRGPGRLLADPALDPVAFVKEHMDADLGAMGSDQVRDPGQLLVTDQHEPGVVVEHSRDVVPAPAQADELGPEGRHAIFYLLVPCGEGVLGGDHEQPIAFLGLVEKCRQGLGRFSRPRDRERRPRWNGREAPDVAGLLRR